MLDYELIQSLKKNTTRNDLVNRRTKSHQLFKKHRKFLPESKLNLSKYQNPSFTNIKFKTLEKISDDRCEAPSPNPLKEGLSEYQIQIKTLSTKCLI